jgi:hypothetical protein
MFWTLQIPFMTGFNAYKKYISYTGSTLSLSCKDNRIIKYTNTLWGQNAEFWYLKAGGICRSTGL